MKYFAGLCLLCVVALMSAFIYDVATHEKAPDTATTAAAKTAKAEKPKEDKEKTIDCLVYRVTDKMDRTLYISIYRNGTARAQNAEDYGTKNHIFYGSYSNVYGEGDNVIRLSFENDHYSTPTLKFNIGEKSSPIDWTVMDLDYIYPEIRYYRSRDPEMRLEIIPVFD